MSSRFQPHPLAAIAVFLLGTAGTAACLQTVLSQAPRRNVATPAGVLMSRPLWTATVTALGAGRSDVARGDFPLDYAKALLLTAAASIVLLLCGAGIARLFSGRPFRSLLARFAFFGWLWWLLPGAWEGLRILAADNRWESLYAFLVASLPLWPAVALAGCFATLFEPAASALPSLDSRERRRRSGLPLVVLLSAIYVVAFVWMNWQLYYGLHVPHGDSAMYEEHLWNVWHGKGFRSYLDDGRLFLGEHLQVVHLLLLPFHMLWPSMLTLDLCESLALAAGAIPVFWMVRRHSGSTPAAVLLAAAYLLYAPMHYLDVAIDLKTFRPTSFGVPAMLFALDQLERRRYRTMFALLLVALSAKEDYAVIVACLGLWMAVGGEVVQRGSGAAASPMNDHSPLATHSSPARESRRLQRWWGVGLALFGAVYLLLAIQVVIPAFRGDAPHYARYFGELGATPGEVARSLLTRPGLVAEKLFSARSALYAAMLLAPVGFLPLRSPGRLAVGLPWFAVLCLLTLSASNTEPLVPWHHFHAPLVPVLFWAAAAGLQTGRGRIGAWISRWRTRDSAGTAPAGNIVRSATFAVLCALFTGAFIGFGPLSVGFWDPGSPAWWRSRYVPGKRAKEFPAAFALVPRDARVFATDFVHTRFTHHKRSYDYSDYKRKSDEERIHPVPGEEYYIVIDARSRYSRMHKPRDVPEFRDHPGTWELLSHPGEEYFIVLHRRD